jgi:hypothetical protein
MNEASKKINDWLDENYPDVEFLLADGFEEAFVGVASQFTSLVTVFDKQKCIEILMRDMSEEEAHEYFDFNVAGAYVGESTPMFIDLYNREND